MTPKQLQSLNIFGQQSEYVTKVGQKKKNQGFRAIYVLRNAMIGYKIRQHTLNKANYLVKVATMNSRSRPSLSDRMMVKTWVQSTLKT